MSESVPNLISGNLLSRPEYQIRMIGTNGWNGASITIEQPGRQNILFGPNFVTGTQVTLPLNLASSSALKVSANTTGSSSSNVGFVIEDLNGNAICSRAAGQSFMVGEVFCEFCFGCVCGDGNLNEGESCDDGNT